MYDLFTFLYSSFSSLAGAQDSSTMSASFLCYWGRLFPSVYYEMPEEKSEPKYSAALPPLPVISQHLSCCFPASGPTSMRRDVIRLHWPPVWYGAFCTSQSLRALPQQPVGLAIYLSLLLSD